MGSEAHFSGDPSAPGKGKEVGGDPENRMDVMDAQPEQWQREGEKLKHPRETWEASQWSLAPRGCGVRRQESGDVLSFQPWGRRCVEAEIKIATGGEGVGFGIYHLC